MCTMKRIIGLVDMDCFYVQVVQRKDPSIREKPCAVVQYNTWRGGGIIAVSYEARKFGVTRNMRGDEAKKKCPEIILVKVPESRGKADLTLFRDACTEVMEVLAMFTENLERASVDEAYMDLTDEINKKISSYNLDEVAMDTFKNTHLINLQNKGICLTSDDHLRATDIFKQWKNQLESDDESYRLAIGAVIANKMRVAVREKCGFTCSAGIGQNKMLAKIVAGFHKPNQQTLVFRSDVPEMFQSTKMRKIRNLGGKLGAQLEEKFNVEYMSQLVPLSLQELRSAVGPKAGETIYWLCRGVDHEPVRPRQLPKSIGCGKNFRGKLMLKTPQDVKMWLTNLCEEMVERMEKDKEQNDRVATLVTVGCTNESDVSQSRRCAVVKHTTMEICEEAFRALCEFNSSKYPSEWKPPIINLNIAASKFVGHGSKNSSNLIKSYMGNNNKRSEKTTIHECRNSSGLSHDDVTDNVNKTAESSSCKISDSTESGIQRKSGHTITIQTSVSKKEIPKYFENSSDGNNNKNLSTYAPTTPRQGTSIASFPNKSPLKHSQDVNNKKRHFTLTSSTSDRVVPSSSNARCQHYSPEKTPQSEVNKQVVPKDLPKEKTNSSPDRKTLPESPIASGEMSNKNKLSKNRQTLFSRFLKPVTISKRRNNNGNLNGEFFVGKNSSLPNIPASNNNNTQPHGNHSQEQKKQEKQRQHCQQNHQNERQQRNSIGLHMTTTINDLMNCERCGKRLLAWDLPDHMDFHVAKDLQDSLHGNCQLRENTIIKIQPPARKKMKTTANSLTMYFSPKKN